MNSRLSGSTKKVIVLIPAYNEEKKIASVISSIKNLHPDFDVLVVDDGSGDSTFSKATAVGATALKHPFNLGYGAALHTGYKFAVINDYDALVQIDGDGQHDPSFMKALLAPIEGGQADVVMGSRFTKYDGAYQSYKVPLARRLGMLFFGTITSWITRQKISDPTSGYQAMNRKAFEWLSSDRFPCDYPDADVIIMLHRSGFKIREIPVRMFENQDKKSMHSGWKPFYYVFKMVLSILVTLMRK